MRGGGITCRRDPVTGHWTWSVRLVLDDGSVVDRLGHTSTRAGAFDRAQHALVALLGADA